MCKSWSITYTCGHIRQVRLRIDTCRGNFTTKATPFCEPKATCNSSPIYSLRATGACGQCARTKEETVLAESLGKLKLSLTFDDPALMAAQAEYDHESFVLSKQFPDAKFKPYKRVETQQPTALLRRSLLSEEVQPEEVEDDNWDEYAKSWSKPYGDATQFDNKNEEGQAAENLKSSDDSGDTWSAREDWASESFASDSSTLETADGWSTPEDWTFESSSSQTNTENAYAASAMLSTVDITAEENLTPSSTAPESDLPSKHGITNPNPLSTPKVIPPHLRNHKATTARSGSKSRSSSEPLKMEVDLYERLQCLPFQYLISVSS